MDKLGYYSEMEARYRKQADNEPMRRDRHLASADAWRLLADMRNAVNFGAQGFDILKKAGRNKNRDIATLAELTQLSEEEVRYVLTCLDTPIT